MFCFLFLIFLELLVMQPPQEYTGLLKVTIKRLYNTGGNFKTGLMNLRVNKDGKMNHVDLTKNQQQMEIVHMFECGQTSCMEVELIEDQTGNTAYIRFPLKQLLVMPRVIHQMELELAERKNGQVSRPVKKVVAIEVDVEYFNAVMGSLVISSLEIEMNRDTDTVTKMDPYIVLDLDGLKVKTSVKNNEGKNCIWHERFEFKITTVAEGRGSLRVRVFDEDITRDDVVGRGYVQLLKEGLLMPTQKPVSHSFNLNYDGSTAGWIKIESQFILKPYN